MPLTHTYKGIHPFTDAEWTAWFKSYRAFLQHYTAMAAEEQVEMLSLNCELYCANKQADRWRDLVQHEVRYGIV
jgi:hypothetical protein